MLASKFSPSLRFNIILFMIMHDNNNNPLQTLNQYGHFFEEDDDDVYDPLSTDDLQLQRQLSSLAMALLRFSCHKDAALATDNAAGTAAGVGGGAGGGGGLPMAGVAEDHPNVADNPSGAPLPKQQRRLSIDLFDQL